MKNLYSTIVLLSCFITVKAQSHEFSGGIGFAQYYGDLNDFNATKSAANLFSDLNTKRFHLSYSLNYRYNFKKMFSLGLGLMHMNLSGADSDNPTVTVGQSEFFRKTRNLNFHSAIYQGFIDARIEPFRTVSKWESEKWVVSPYAGIGIGLFNFNPKTFYNGQEVELQPLMTEGQNPYDLTQICYPASLGLKFYSPSRKFSVSMDFVYTFTNTDYIDDVSTRYANPSSLSSPMAVALADRRPEIDPSGTYSYITNPGEIRGHEKYNDYFLTGQLRLSYYINNTAREHFYKCCGF